MRNHLLRVFQTKTLFRFPTVTNNMVMDKTVTDANNKILDTNASANFQKVSNKYH